MDDQATQAIWAVVDKLNQTNELLEKIIKLLKKQAES